MDYEKAYKAALKTATQWIKDGCSVGEQTCLECVFPELRESEDERIRKFLVYYFASYKIDNVTTKLNGVRIDDILNYLEKQKDASKATEAVERIDKYIDEHLANAHDMKDSNPDKKYYRGWDDALGKMAGILQDVYSVEKKEESLRDFIDDFPYSDQKAQKSIENEDERIRKALINYFKAHSALVGENWNGIECDDVVAYLEKQKEQNPVEWSEEDEDMLNSCISSIEEAKENRYAYKETDGDTSYDHEIDWLKSIRPQGSKDSLQTHWKPSEEQMNALQNAIALTACDKELARLYNQLKKL